LTPTVRIIDYMCSSFLADRAEVWDNALGAQGIPLKIRRNADDSFCDAATMVARMDELGYETIVVSTSDQHHHGTVFEYDPVANRFEEMAALAERHPGRFAANWAVNPQLGMAGVRRAREVLANRWVAALWIHTHSFDRRFDHADYYPYYALAAEFDVPVVMQAGASGGLMPSECGVPGGLDRPAIPFREVWFVLSHTGHPWEREAINMALKFPNVYLGACAYPPRHWPAELHTFLRGPGRTKVIFGTNFPTVGHRHVLSQLADLDVAPATFANFVRDNALRVFTRLAPASV
jgi:uncharacterized protein